MAGCTLIAPSADEPCYSYMEPVADAFGAIGEWRLSFIASTAWAMEQPHCESVADSGTEVRLLFRANGGYERWEDGVRVETATSFTITGGRISAAGREYSLRPDSRLVYDLSPMDGPVYVFERQGVGSN